MINRKRLLFHKQIRRREIDRIKQNIRNSRMENAKILCSVDEHTSQQDNELKLSFPNTDHKQLSLKNQIYSQEGNINYIEQLIKSFSFYINFNQQLTKESIFELDKIIKNIWYHISIEESSSINSDQLSKNRQRVVELKLIMHKSVIDVANVYMSLSKEDKQQMKEEVLPFLRLYFISLSQFVFTQLKTTYNGYLQQIFQNYHSQKQLRFSFHLEEQCFILLLAMQQFLLDFDQATSISQKASFNIHGLYPSELLNILINYLTIDGIAIRKRTLILQMLVNLTYLSCDFSEHLIHSELISSLKYFMLFNQEYKVFNGKWTLKEASCSMRQMEEYFEFAGNAIMLLYNISCIAETDRLWEEGIPQEMMLVLNEVQSKNLQQDMKELILTMIVGATHHQLFHIVRDCNVLEWVLSNISFQIQHRLQLHQSPTNHNPILDISMQCLTYFMKAGELLQTKDGSNPYRYKFIYSQAREVLESFEEGKIFLEEYTF